MMPPVTDLTLAHPLTSLKYGILSTFGLLCLLRFTDWLVGYTSVVSFHLLLLATLPQGSHYGVSDRLLRCVLNVGCLILHLCLDLGH